MSGWRRTIGLVCLTAMALVWTACAHHNEDAGSADVETELLDAEVNEPATQPTTQPTSQPTAHQHKDGCCSMGEKTADADTGEKKACCAKMDAAGEGEKKLSCCA